MTRHIFRLEGTVDEIGIVHWEIQDDDEDRRMQDDFDWIEYPTDEQQERDNLCFEDLSRRLA
jgi:hypothetical protein